MTTIKPLSANKESNVLTKRHNLWINNLTRFRNVADVIFRGSPFQHGKSFFKYVLYMKIQYIFYTDDGVFDMCNNN